MIPKILDYTDGIITITLEAFLIKELNDIINKFGKEEALPYLAYVHLVTHPESPYINLPEEEISDSITFDITQGIGFFDEEEVLLKPAIERLNSLFDTKTRKYHRSLGIAMDKASLLLRTEELTTGKDGNLSEINRMIERAGSTLKSYKEVEKMVDEELKTKMRGKSQLGEY